jgi:hypothetical protein
MNLVAVGLNPSRASMRVPCLRAALSLAGLIAKRLDLIAHWQVCNKNRKAPPGVGARPSNSQYFGERKHTLLRRERSPNYKTKRGQRVSVPYD